MKIIKGLIENLPTVYLVPEESDLSEISSSFVNIGGDRFSGKLGESLIYREVDSISILIGIGKLESISTQDTRKIGFDLSKLCNQEKIKEANVRSNIISQSQTSLLEGLIEGILQSSYSFDKYKSKKTEYSLEYIHIDMDDDMGISKVIEETQNLLDGINIARNLGNEPANIIYPESLCKEIEDIFHGLDVNIKILNLEQIEDLNMEGLIAVSQGSDREPKFITIEYKPSDNGPMIALVGKGLTYDSGGYAIKPPKVMSLMKTDMCGAAAVIGALYTIAKNKIKLNVTVVIAACENMISGRSYKNGDIVGTMKGSTIEVIDTDAEGRITLADSCYYASTVLNSDYIVDVATLTGTSMAALGDRTTALISNDDFLCNCVLDASIMSGEHAHRLPAVDYHVKMIESNIADLKNLGGPYGGAITAGLFIEHFIENKPWVHMDIAGPSYTDSTYDYIPQGATGIPVKTLVNMIDLLSKRI